MARMHGSDSENILLSCKQFVADYTVEEGRGSILMLHKPHAWRQELGIAVPMFRPIHIIYHGKRCPLGFLFARAPKAVCREFLQSLAWQWRPS